MSGFLFFRNLSKENIKQKLLKKIRTLIIPYIIWNSIIYLFYVIISNFSLFEVEQELSLISYLYSVASSNLSPLWFIRTLVVYSVISPLIAFTWKNKAIALGWIVALVATNYLGISVPVVSNYYLPIFLLGAYGAIYHKDVIFNSSDKKMKYSGAIGMIAVLVIAFSFGFDISYKWQYTMRLIATLSFWFVADAIKPDFQTKTWEKSSFAIFCIHCMLIKVFKSIYVKYLPHNDVQYLLQVVLNVLFSVGTIILIDFIMKHACPKIWAIAMGGRVDLRSKRDKQTA